MPRPKPINYDPPLDLSKLPAPSAVTKRDKLKLLDDLRTHAGGFLAAGINRVTFNAIERDVRIGQAQRNGAPAETRAPSKAEIRIEQSASIPEKALERKIDDDISLKIEDSYLALYHTDNGLLFYFTPDNADRLAHALTELADDLRQDANARAWSQDVLEQQR